MFPRRQAVHLPTLQSLRRVNQLSDAGVDASPESAGKDRALQEKSLRTARVKRDDDWGKASPEKKRKAREFVERWRDPLFLHQHTIHIKHESVACADEPRTNAECKSLPEYHSLVVTIYPKFWDGTTDEERTFFILHEMCHVITQTSRNLAFDAVNEKLVRGAEIIRANEEMTDWIANIVFHQSAALKRKR